MNLIGKKVLFKSGGKTLKGTVTQEDLNNAHGYPLDIEVTVRGGRTYRLSKVDAGVAILVPEDEIPAAWKKVLGENPKADVAVCYVMTMRPEPTTLVCKHGLGRLQSVITSEEICDMRLHEGEALPCEGKPELTESGTTYRVGDQTIEMDDQLIERYS